ncbi:MAG: DUF3108 domain-containing protein [Lewinellaceae bacterium]|nr:DUF3108 domain-containing protein [Lewinellaceae bacterium]
MKAIQATVLSFGLITMAFLTPNLPQNPPGEKTTVDSTAGSFQHGEKLTYKIYYNWNFVWLAAGEVTFQVFDEDKQYHYRAHGETYDSYEWFFKVKDTYDSWVDKNTMLPSYSERSILEGDYQIFEKISFNQAAKKTTVWRSKKRGETETKTEHTVQDKVHDVLSSLYYLRNIDFASRKKGAEEPFRIFMDQDEFPLKMRYLGKDEKKKIRGMKGHFNTLKFEPQVIVGNVFKDDTKMTVWVSDDQNRIPVLIESPVSVGSVKMVLKEYQGLKSELKARVH